MLPSQNLRILLVRCFNCEGGRKPIPGHGKDFLFLEGWLMELINQEMLDSILGGDAEERKKFERTYSTWEGYFDALKIKLLAELHQKVEKSEYLAHLDSTANTVIKMFHSMMKDKPFRYLDTDFVGYLVDQIGALGTWSYQMGSSMGAEFTAKELLEITNERETLNEAEKKNLKSQLQRAMRAKSKLEEKNVQKRITSKHPKMKMMLLYSKYSGFYEEKRNEYIGVRLSEYGADKFAVDETVKKIRKDEGIIIKPNNLKQAMTRIVIRRPIRGRVKDRY
jgi:hypothetical protein